MIITVHSSNFCSKGELKETSPKYASIVKNDGILTSPCSDVYQSAKCNAMGPLHPKLHCDNPQLFFSPVMLADGGGAIGRFN
jgi:hypothetical protein